MAPTIVHFELPAQDADRAQRFYEQIFGWQFQDSEMPGIDYRMLQGGEPGGAVYPAESAGQGPVIYFGTHDIDAAVAQVRELGGDAQDKEPIPGIGWFARCKDTEGNSFSMFQTDESAAPPAQ
jgi:predicted enzyme related to lactoylglutathione lyase